MVWLFVGAFDLLLEPQSLRGVLDVHVLETDGAAVGVTQHSEDLAQEHGAPAAETSGHKLAVQVPEGQPVAFDLEVGVRALAIFEGVNVCHQVAANAKRVDELLHPGGLVDVIRVVFCNVFGPVDRHVGNAKRGKDFFVEPIATDEEFVDLLEVFTRTSALNNAVVIGRGQGNRLADTKFREGFLG